jgi:hypothetical protein
LYSTSLFVDLKKASDLLRMEDVCIIFIGCDMPRKLVQLMKMCLSDICNKVYVGKHLCDMFTIHNGLKQGDASLQLLFSFPLDCSARKVQ